jgi:hypothetical protein
MGWAMTSDLRRVTPQSSQEAIHEPSSDWVPLDRAPYYCYPEGLVTSSQAWKLALKTEVERQCPPDRESEEPWSFVAESDELEFLGDWDLRIHAGGIMTTIWPGGAYVKPGFGDWVIECSASTMWGRSKDVLEASEWQESSLFGDVNNPLVASGSDRELMEDIGSMVKAEHKARIRHRSMLFRLFYSWRNSFWLGVRSGAFHIMARKNSVLAPFERVTNDQWQFFRLDEPSDTPLNKWHDHRDPAGLRDTPSACAATGPAGERLFAIYVAPGISQNVGLASDADKCQMWVRELLRNYPERAPKAKDTLLNEAATLFPGLTKKAIEHIVLKSAVDARPRRWFRAGRPPSKSPRKSSSNK